MRSICSPTLSIAAGLAGLLPPLAGAAPDSLADFYRGRQLTLVVGYGPGGSASFYAQALAHHMGRFLAGTPSLVVQHMPGRRRAPHRQQSLQRGRARRDGARHHGPHDGDRAAHRLLERIYATPKIAHVKAVTE
jgi:hypothetical protein